MTNQDWKIGAMVRSKDGTSGTGVIISNASITIDGVTKTLIQDPVEVSTGKTKNQGNKGGSASVGVSIESPYLSEVLSEGTGRVENLSKNFPKLKLGTKKNRKASNKGLYAKLRIKSENEKDSEQDVEYFDLVIGKSSEVCRDNSPHFGFRPSSSSHFYVKTNELDAEHKSHGEVVFGGSVVIPKKIIINCKNQKTHVIIKFKYDELSNSIIADNIRIA
jgi:hypothetical protein